MNELTTTTENAIVENVDYRAKALEYLSSMGNSLPEKHKTQSLEMAAAFNLNPFKREIYAVGYGDKWNIITGYEVYLKRAERVGKLDGWDVTVNGHGDDMTATVTIFRKDWSHPFKHTVLFTEVCQKTKDKNGNERLNSVWSKMPSFMCRKVAIAQAFRLCFPDDFGGMPYTSDEIATEENHEPTVEELKHAEIVEEKIVCHKNDLNEIASLMNVYSEIFNEETREKYRAMLREKGSAITLQSVKAAIDEANKGGTPSAEETKELEAIF